MKVLGNYPFLHDESCEVLCFDGAAHATADDYDPHAPTDWASIEQALPAGWAPDVVLLKTPQYFPLPRGIERCPWPSAVLLDDWFGSVDYLPDNLCRFDYIFTDRASLDLLAAMGVHNAAYWPCFGHDPGRFRRMSEVARDLDVSFTGNFNINIQTERLPWIRRVCELPARRSVAVECGLWGDDYVRLLNRSRIVFNRSIKGEMNMRAFEAPACGALLFLEESNREVRDFLEPDRECVLYTRDNLTARMRHFLDNETHRAAVAEAGSRRIRQFSYPRLFSQLLQSIRELDLRPGANRSLPRRYFAGIEHRDLVQHCFSSAGRPPDTLDRVGAVMRTAGRDVCAINDCAVILLTTIEDQRTRLAGSRMQSLQAMAVRLLDAALACKAGYVTARFNRAQAFFLFGNPQRAAAEFRALLEAPPSEALDDYQGQTYPIHYQFPLRYQWSAALTATLDDPRRAAHARHGVIRAIAAIRLASLAINDRLFEEAIALCDQAESALPGFPAAATSRAVAMAHLPADRRRDTALENAVSLNPFNVELWRIYARHLLETGRTREAARFIEAARLIARRVAFMGEPVIADLDALFPAATAP
jgi:tetratricopeptide (TPR) repeat protein